MFENYPSKIIKNLETNCQKLKLNFREAKIPQKFQKILQEKIFEKSEKKHLP